MTSLRVSPSSLSSFRNCRRRWAWERQYEPKRPIPELWLGRLVHSGLAEYYISDRDLSSALSAYKREAASAMDQVKENFSGVWEDIESVWFDLVDLGEAMLQTYDEYERLDPLPGKVQAVERSKVIRIPFTADGIEVTLAFSGRVDLIMEDEGRPYIVDHKTASRSPDLSGLDIDEQMTAYAYLFWRTTGVVPDRIVYNVLIKKAPQPPKVLQSGRLSRAKNQNTTLKLYEKTLSERGEDPADYAEILDYLRSSSYSAFIKREISCRSVAALEQFEARLAYTALDIITCKNSPGFIYPNPSTWRCARCQFQLPCRLREDGGDYGYVLRTEFTEK